MSKFFVNVFQCVPIRGFWDRTINPTCGVNDTQFFYGQSIPNILTDIAILALPVRFIWHLQTGRAQKVLLMGTFVTGGLYVNKLRLYALAYVGSSVVIISITRLVYLVRLDLTSQDVTWNFVNVEIWTLLEMGFAIVSGKSASPDQWSVNYGT